MKKFYYILITFVMCICTVTLTTSCSKSEMDEAENYANNGNGNNGEISFDEFMADNGIGYGERILTYDKEEKLFYFWFTKSNGNIYGKADSADGDYKGIKRQIEYYKIVKNGTNNYTLEIASTSDNDSNYYCFECYTFDGHVLRLIEVKSEHKSSVLK